LRSIAAAVGAAKKFSSGLKIEVECKNLEDVREVLEGEGVVRIMLDNMPLNEMRKAVKMAAAA